MNPSRGKSETADDDKVYLPASIPVEKGLTGCSKQLRARSKIELDFGDARDSSATLFLAIGDRSKPENIAMRYEKKTSERRQCEQFGFNIVAFDRPRGGWGKSGIVEIENTGERDIKTNCLGLVAHRKNRKGRQSLLIRFAKVNVLELTTRRFFDGLSYLDEHADIAHAVEAGNIDAAYDHFIKYGHREKRAAFYDRENGFTRASRTDLSTRALRHRIERVEAEVRFVKKELEKSPSLETVGGLEGELARIKSENKAALGKVQDRLREEVGGLAPTAALSALCKEVSSLSESSVKRIHLLDQAIAAASEDALAGAPR